MSSVSGESSAESSARFIGSAVLYTDTSGNWHVGKPGQKVSEYKPVKFNGNSAITDQTYKFTAISVDTAETGGYRLYLRSNDNVNTMLEANVDEQGNITGGRALSLADIYAVENRLGQDHNNNGGLGDVKVLVQPGNDVSLFVDGSGAFEFKKADGAIVPMTFANQAVTQTILKGYEITSVTSTEGGFKFYASNAAGTVFELATDSAGAVSPGSIKPLSAEDISTAEASSGEDIDDKGDTKVVTGWTSSLKNSAIKAAVEQQTANGAKISHAGLVSILDAAIASLNGASKVGADVFNDLKAMASRGKELFTSKDLNGAETGYLQYIFEKLVNGSKANNFYTGGETKQQTLGDLSAESSVDALQKLQNKWLLGLDRPNPMTEGDTANPNAVAASGLYKAFEGPLIAGNTATFDVSQGSAGTCYLLAGIAALASATPTVFNSMFVSNGTGANGAPTWGVRFYGNDGSVNWVTVDNQFVVTNPSDDLPAYAKTKGFDAFGAPTTELWAPIVEKAYSQANEMQVFGRKKEINAMYAIEGGLAEIMGNITGNKAIQWAAANGDNVNGNPFMPVMAVPAGSSQLSEYVRALNSSKPIFIGSFLDTKNDSGQSLFVKGHAFIAYDADTSSTTNSTVKVYNPWGQGASHYASPFDGDLVKLVGTEGLEFWTMA